MIKVKHNKIFSESQYKSDMGLSCIYQITNKATGDFYVGKTRNLRYRIASHPCYLNKKNKTPLQEAYFKHGPDSFEVEVLEVVDVAKLDSAERRWIKKLDPPYNVKNSKGIDQRRFEDNVCDNKHFFEMQKKKISCTIHEAHEEKAWVLAKLSPGDFSNVSQVIDAALADFFEDENIKRKLDEGYERWKKM